MKCDSQKSRTKVQTQLIGSSSSPSPGCLGRRCQFPDGKHFRQHNSQRKRRKQKLPPCVNKHSAAQDAKATAAQLASQTAKAEVASLREQAERAAKDAKVAAAQIAEASENETGKRNAKQHEEASENKPAKRDATQHEEAQYAVARSSSEGQK